MIYLDHAAMTPPLPVALEAYRTAPFGNPSSEHAVGQAARDALEHTREKIASLIDCEPEEIYFTSTATEAAAFAAHSLREGGYELIPSVVEHHAVSENARGYTRTSSVAFGRMHTNNETGEILPIPSDVGNGDTLWLCDATAAVGHVNLSFKKLGCDYLIADAIKFGGVPGAAFLIAKKKRAPRPAYSRRRAGARNAQRNGKRPRHLRNGCGA